MYVPGTSNIISSYDVIVDESFSSMLAYTPQSYEEAMYVCTNLSYTPYSTNSREQTDNIITLTQFEEGNLVYETKNLLSKKFVAMTKKG